MRKKLFSSLLCVMLLFGLSVPAFAAKTPLPSGTFTVENGNTVVGTFKTSTLSSAYQDFLRRWVNSENNFLSYDDRGRFIFWIYTSPDLNFNIYPDYLSISSRIGNNGQYERIMFSSSLVFESFWSDNLTGGNFLGNLVSSTYVATHNLDTSGIPDNLYMDIQGTLKLRDDAGIFGYSEPDPEPVTLTVDYQYSDGTKAADSVIHSALPSAVYSIPSPAIIGHTPDKPTISGTMPESNQTVTVTYSKNVHDLTIRYRYSGGEEAAPVVVRPVAFGSLYDVPSPALSGYVPDKPKVSGTMPDNAVSVEVTYTGNRHNLTVRYLYEDGAIASAPHTQSIGYGEEYRVESPVIAEYSSDVPVVSGTMPDSDVTVDVTYSNQQFTLTVHYVFEDGTKAAEDVVRTMHSGGSYAVQSPDVVGFVADFLTVSGTMPAQDLVLTVTYADSMYALTVQYLYDNGSKAADSVVQLHPAGRAYTIASPSIADYTPDISIVTGEMPESNYMVTVTYRRTGSGGSSGGSSSSGSSNPFDPPEGEWSGHDPFKKPTGDGWTGYDPFRKPTGTWNGPDPFQTPTGTWNGPNPFDYFTER